MSVFYNDSETVLPEDAGANPVRKTQTVAGYVRGNSNKYLS